MGNPFNFGNLGRITPDVEKMNLDDVDFRNDLNAGGELFFNELRKHIEHVEARLKDDEDLHVIHAQTGRVLRVLQFGYRKPNVVYLVAVDSDGNKSHVFSHVRSLQVELRLMKLTEPQPVKEPIGFTITSE